MGPSPGGRCPLVVVALRCACRRRRLQRRPFGNRNAVCEPLSKRRRHTRGGRHPTAGCGVALLAAGAGSEAAEVAAGALHSAALPLLAAEEKPTNKDAIRETYSLAPIRHTCHLSYTELQICMWTTHVAYGVSGTRKHIHRCPFSPARVHKMLGGAVSAKRRLYRGPQGVGEARVPRVVKVVAVT